MNVEVGKKHWLTFANFYGLYFRALKLKFMKAHQFESYHKNKIGKRLRKG
jgi:hypothetical protein